MRPVLDYLYFFNGLILILVIGAVLPFPLVLTFKGQSVETRGPLDPIPFRG